MHIGICYSFGGCINYFINVGGRLWSFKKWELLVRIVQNHSLSDVSTIIWLFSLSNDYKFSGPMINCLWSFIVRSKRTDVDFKGQTYTLFIDKVLKNTRQYWPMYPAAVVVMALLALKQHGKYYEKHRFLKRTNEFKMGVNCHIFNGTIAQSSRP